MSRPRSALFPVALAAAITVLLWGSPIPLSSAPEDGKKAKKTPQGSSYRNTAMGVSARAPVGWKMIADRGKAPSRWQRLVTFNDPDSDAQAVLSARPRTSASLDALLGGVRKAWEKSAGQLRVSSMRKIEASALNPVGKVVVDASFGRKNKPKKATKGVPPPPGADITTYRVQATYYLGGGQEFLLYATGQQTHWSRLRSRLGQLRDSVRFDAGGDEGPRGEGTYRNDKIGFTCRFPKNYTVVSPQRENHIVQFAGVGENDPVLSVYALRWEQTARQDGDRLVAFYEEDKGGTASLKTYEVAGNEGALLTATAMIGGKDKTIMIAIVKRGDTCFRLRASMPTPTAGKGGSVFRAFVNGFRMKAAPK